MSTRYRDLLYCGAVGRIDRSKIARLGPRYAVQIKRDGGYVVVTTAADGSLVSMTTRAGEPVGRHLANDFCGVRWAPNAVVVGELEAFTERSVGAVAARGRRLIHLHDVLRLGGRDLSRLPYHERRDALMRAESALVNADRDRPYRLDRRGNAHHLTRGDFVSPIPMSWRRMPVVVQWPARCADQVWTEHVEAGGEEGLVVVALDAPIGKRGAKRKCKAERTIDCVVVSAGPTAAILRWPGGEFACSAAGKSLSLSVGAIVEILCDGLYDSGEPKHPRITRVREDLSPVTVQ